MIFWSFCSAKSTGPAVSRLAAQFDLLETRPTHHTDHRTSSPSRSPNTSVNSAAYGGFAGDLSLQGGVHQPGHHQVTTRKRSQADGGFAVLHRLSVLSRRHHHPAQDRTHQQLGGRGGRLAGDVRSAGCALCGLPTGPTLPPCRTRARPRPAAARQAGAAVQEQGAAGGGSGARTPGSPCTVRGPRAGSQRPRGDRATGDRSSSGHRPGVVTEGRVGGAGYRGRRAHRRTVRAEDTGTDAQGQRRVRVDQVRAVGQGCTAARRPPGFRSARRRCRVAASGPWAADSSPASALPADRGEPRSAVRCENSSAPSARRRPGSQLGM